MRRRRALFVLPLALGACGTSDEAATMQRCTEWIDTNLGYRSTFDPLRVSRTALPELTIMRVDFEGENTFGVKVSGLALCIFDRNNGRTGRFRAELSSVTTHQR